MAILFKKEFSWNRQQTVKKIKEQQTLKMCFKEFLFSKTKL